MQEVPPKLLKKVKRNNWRLGAAVLIKGIAKNVILDCYQVDDRS